MASFSNSKRRCGLFAAFSTIVSTLLIFASGCGGPSSAFDVAPYAKPSAQAAEQFCVTYEELFRKGDAQKLQDMFDFNALAATSTKDVDATSAAKISFRDAVLKKQLPSMMTQLTKSVTNGGSMKLIRVHEVDGETRALFRFVEATGAHNYHDLILCENADGTVQVRDLYIFLSGEKLTTTMRRQFILAVSTESSIVDRLSGAEGEMAKHRDELIAFNQHIAARNYPAALQTYTTFPDVLKKHKNVLLQRLTAAQRLAQQTRNLNQYKSAIEDVYKQFPDDPTSFLIATD